MSIRRRGRIGIVIGLSLMGSALLAPSAEAKCSSPFPLQTGFFVVCPPAGAAQVFQVPSGVSRVLVRAVGASGGSGGSGSGSLAVAGSGGQGATATGVVAVTAGRPLYVYVGGAGGGGAAGSNPAPATAGFNGGRDGGAGTMARSDAGGGGGGASDVRTCVAGDASCDSLRSRLIVAAGGGGGGGGVAINDFAPGGAGGSGGTDGNGADATSLLNAGGGGRGASLTAGGVAGGPAASSGVFGLGGRGAPTTGDEPPVRGGGGGGGGGGLFGGGGGAAGSEETQVSGGGGGGSSLGPAGTTYSVPAPTDPVQQASVTIAYALPGSNTPPPDPFGTVFPAKLEILRARVLASKRRLSVLAPITGRASGEVRAAFQAAGATTSFTARVDAKKRRVRFSHRIPARQARLGTGILTLAYPGDANTQPQEVRLRAASGRARLRAGRPRITAGRLKARGAISSRARGVVRLQLLYEPPLEQTRTLRFTAPIRDGSYAFDERLPSDVVDGIAQRRGVVHSYTLFTGYLPRRIRGELRSLQVLGSRSP